MSSAPPEQPDRVGAESASSEACSRSPEAVSAASRSVPQKLARVTAPSQASQVSRGNDNKDSFGIALNVPLGQTEEACKQRVDELRRIEGDMRRDRLARLLTPRGGAADSTPQHFVDRDLGNGSTLPMSRAESRATQAKNELSDAVGVEGMHTTTSKRGGQNAPHGQEESLHPPRSRCCIIMH